MQKLQHNTSGPLINFNLQSNTPFYICHIVELRCNTLIDTFSDQEDSSILDIL